MLLREVSILRGFGVPTFWTFLSSFLVNNQGCVRARRVNESVSPITYYAHMNPHGKDSSSLDHVVKVRLTGDWVVILV